jgi:hypothetical protein
MLTKILGKASEIRRLVRTEKAARGISKAITPVIGPSNKGLTGGALNKQLAIRQAYSKQSFVKGYEAAKNKKDFGKKFQESFADNSEMKKYLYKKTPKTQMALSAAKYGTVFGAGGYFLNREDENEIE